MDPACWRRVEGILESADERQGSEREAFLAAACDGDEELRREVAPCRSGPNTRRLRLQAVATLRPPLQRISVSEPRPRGAVTKTTLAPNTVKPTSGWRPTWHVR